MIGNADTSQNTKTLSPVVNGRTSNHLQEPFGAGFFWIAENILRRAFFIVLEYERRLFIFNLTDDSFLKELYGHSLMRRRELNMVGVLLIYLANFLPFPLAIER